MPPTIHQVTVSGAILVNAIVGEMLYRAAFSDAGHQPIIAATVLAIAVAGIAVQILARPVSWALDLARGAAVGMLLGLVAIGLLAFVAANFESGLSRGGPGGIVALMVGLFVVQLAILFGSARIEGRDLGLQLLLWPAARSSSGCSSSACLSARGCSKACCHR
jgi:hypothetical protein